MMSNYLKRTIWKLSTYTNKRQRQPICNPNVSLISNISQTKNIHQLLSIYQLMSDKFTPKHLANAARKFTQLIKYQHSKKQHRQLPLISHANTQIFRRFLTELCQVDFNVTEVQQYLSFALFLQKISKFKEHLKGGENEIALIEKQLKSKVVRQLNKSILSGMSFQQVYSLLNALWDYLEPHNQDIILNHLLEELQNNPYCSCFHLALLTQQLRQKAKNTQLVAKIQKLCFQQAKKQLDSVQNYLHSRNLIQIYNAFFQQHSQQIRHLLPIINASLHEDPNDTSVFAIFFKNSLLEFESNLDSVRGQEQVVKSIQKILQTGDKAHRLKFSNQQKEEAFREQRLNDL